MTPQYMGLGDPSAATRIIEGELDQKLRDRVRALQEREAQLLDESGGEGLPHHGEIARRLMNGES